MNIITDRVGTHSSRCGGAVTASGKDAEARLLTSDACLELANQMRRFARGGGSTVVHVSNSWSGDLRWARNRVSLVGDRRRLKVTVSRWVNGSMGQASTNQTDDVSLECVVRAAERMSAVFPGVTIQDFRPPSPELPIPKPRIWNDATYNTTAQMRADLAKILVERAEEHAMLSAGFLSMSGAVLATIRKSNSGNTEASPSSDSTVSLPSGGDDFTSRDLDFQQYTMGECSMTVRHPKGLGSGWAGISGYDWTQIDGQALADRALQKCLTSLNPVAIEPGRYTVILEPQATYELIVSFLSATARRPAEAGQGPFVLGRDEALGLYRTKLGLKVVDERITIYHDPEDPQLGILAAPALAPITWVEHGILTTLSNDRASHALPLLNDNLPSLGRGSFRMTGGTTSMEEMISTTERGLIVSRFANVMGLDATSLLYTGLTRDGVWLVEHGKIAKAVKNMRFTESPLFALNNLDQLGIAVPIFSLQRDEPQSAIVPPIKVNDFSFTSMIDAV